MLTKIRKGTDNILVKIILGLVAFSFIGIGGASFIGGNSRGNIVLFDKTNSISMENFQIAKAREVEALQSQNGINLTDENIAELGLDNSVLRRLINESMVDYLANYYDFDTSDELVIKFIRKSPFFKNAHGEFDLSIFKNAFHNSQNREDEYLKSIKKHLMTTALLDVFMDSFVPPKAMTENMVSYMAETRVVDLLSIDLDYKPKNYTPELLQSEQLEDFYQNNQELFVLPELRSFDYIKADRVFLAKKLKISEAELKQFFEDNKDEFTEKNYASAKKQVQEVLASERLEELTNELAKNFEEDVSSGLTLQEIAEKYELKVSSVKDMSLVDMNTSSVAENIELADSVFEMIEGEVSYPIEVADKNEILLINLKTIIQSRQQSFAEVENDIKNILEKRMLAFFNVKKLEEANKNYDPKQINRASLQAQGISVLGNQSFTRAELPLQEKLPVELLKSIFITEKDKSTPLVGDSKKVYVAYLKAVNNSKAKMDAIRKDSGDHFSNIIKEGLFQELITHLTRKNNMQIIQSPSS
ncbi:MAG: SurA N-terminal domain-containing protein [Rickettsiaceae bacterium]|nr:SurA N-terminal domain-containing protein [Rickettsiaceae bacterium]MDP4832755.1 SurA N-terminal domain-containing protein [Rickettsiaceae bacterium]MDP5020957.1 SurA N-terminal domain-containing protein [Rickettsiaceae bacterium]MDP5083492.1 SurA N-terminal domain-containing protein [Rickettsiaceae bacterium]